MTTPGYLVEPQIQYLHQLLDEIAKGILQVPRFQRTSVWKDEQKRKLFESIYESVPIGSILVWRTTIQTLARSPKIGPLELPKPSSKDGVRSYILDGFQRLSTLCGAFYPRTREARPKKKEERRWEVYFDLNKKEFHLGSESKNIPETWLPMWKLLDSVQLLQFQRGLKDDGLIETADRLANAFRSYKIPVIPIVTDDISQATTTFQRVNSQGTKMTEVNMVNALSWREDFDLLARLEDLEPKLEEFHWGEVDQKVLLNIVKASLGVSFYKSDPEGLSNKLRERPAVLDEAITNLKRAALFLKKRCGIFSDRLLPYEFQAVILAETLRQNEELPEATEEKLVEWFWLTTYTSFFAGLNDSTLQIMLSDVINIGKTGTRRWWGSQQIQMEPLRSFDFRGARAKAMMLRLAELKPLGLNGKELSANQLLSDHGPQALLQIIPTSQLPKNKELISPAANVIIVEPTEANQVREAFLTNPQTLSSAFLRSHLISEDAAKAIQQKEFTNFLQVRAADLETLEANFFEKMRVSYFKDAPQEDPRGEQDTDE